MSICPRSFSETIGLRRPARPTRRADSPGSIRSGSHSARSGFAASLVSGDDEQVPELPTGTVTVLFTDFEGSTRLLEEMGEEGYVEALAEHHRALREAFGAAGGVEVDTQGDAFFYAFADAAAALAAAVQGKSGRNQRWRPIVAEWGFRRRARGLRVRHSWCDRRQDRRGRAHGSGRARNSLRRVPLGSLPARACIAVDRARLRGRYGGCRGRVLRWGRPSCSSMPATITARTAVRLYALERNDFLAAVTGYSRAMEAGEAVVAERLVPA